MAKKEFTRQKARFIMIINVYKLNMSLNVHRDDILLYIFTCLLTVFNENNFMNRKIQ